MLPPGSQNTSWHTYEIELPEGVISFSAELLGLSADADLYLRKNQPATVSAFECRSFNGGTAAEICTLDVGTTPPVSAGPWFVSVTNQTEDVAISYVLRISWSLATPDSPPTVFTGLANSISSSGATLEGEVNPEGLSTSSHFEYGPNASYGNATAPQDAGSGDFELPVMSGLSELQCGQTYHYRLVATNAAGTSLADDRSFSTGECSPEPLLLDRDATVAKVLPPGPRQASWHYYKVLLPDDVASFTTELFDLTADADLYVRKGLAPTPDTYYCSPYLGETNPETCVFDGGTNPAVAPGYWYIAVTNWTENESIGYSLRVSWTALPLEAVFSNSFEDTTGAE